MHKTSSEMGYIMLGSLVNAGAIIVGGLIGIAFKKGIPKSFEDGINKALGIAVLVLGLNGVTSAMLRVKDGKLASSGELVLIICLVVGTLIGEWLKIDDKLGGFAGKIESKYKMTGFSASFVNGTLIYCVGAMAIIGALNDGLTGDSSVLYVKSLLDGISSIVLGATLGAGVIFAAIPVLLYQGLISLCAGFLQPVLTPDLLTSICSVGFCLVMCIGINFLGIAKIKTANMLPALLIVPICYIVTLM